MDREFLTDLFSAFGPVTLRRMFSGYGVSVDGTTFALVLRGMVHLRVDEQTVARFEEEGVKPFQYDTRGKTIMVASYWQLPARLYDDPEELAEWARLALAAAERAAAKKRARGKSRKVAVGRAQTPVAASKAKAKHAKAKSSRTRVSSAKSSSAKKPRSRAAPAKSTRAKTAVRSRTRKR